MSVELKYLIYVCILMIVIWVPYVLAHIAFVGPLRAFSYPDGEPEMPIWARRLKRAHYNLVENAVPFAGAVIAGELLNIHSTTTAMCAAIFFWARLAHPLAQMSGIFGLRTVAFTVSWVVLATYYFTLLTTDTSIAT